MRKVTYPIDRKIDQLQAIVQGLTEKEKKCIRMIDDSQHYVTQIIDEAISDCLLGHEFDHTVLGTRVTLMMNGLWNE